MTEDKTELWKALENLAVLDLYVSMGAISDGVDLSKAELRLVHDGKVMATWRAGEFLDNVRLVSNAMFLILDRAEADPTGEEE